MHEFGGNETSRDQRVIWSSVLGSTRPGAAFTVLVTILSGRLGDGSNSYHVVKGGTTRSTDVLDNVIISDGKANGASPDDSGAGMYAGSGMPTLSNVLFYNNNAAGQGGGLYSSANRTPLTGVVFDTDAGAGGGGGMFSENSFLTLTNVTFRTNCAGSIPRPSSCTTSSNGGGLYVDNSDTVELTGVTFEANWAATGGGLYGNLASLTLSRVMFNSNNAANGGSLLPCLTHPRRFPNP